MQNWLWIVLAAAGVTTLLVAPAEARLDHSPIASLYDEDGRAPVVRERRRDGELRTRSARKADGARSRTRAARAMPVGDRPRRPVAEARGGGASRGCLQASARALLDRIESAFGPVRLVSTCRPGAVVAGSGRPSKHRYGLAVDFEAGGRKQAIVNWLRANHNGGGTMTYAHKGHIHVDIGQRFVSLGSGGRRRRG